VCMPVQCGAYCSAIDTKLPVGNVVSMVQLINDNNQRCRLASNSVACRSLYEYKRSVTSISGGTKPCTFKVDKPGI